MINAFSGNYIQVTVDDGIERVYLPQSVHTFLVTKDGKIRITVEKQLGTDETKEKIQGGILDENEDPSVCAKRELLEELGMTARKWQLFDVQRLTGTVNDIRHYFIARELEQVSVKTDGEVLHTLDCTIDDLYEKAMTGSFSPLTQATIAKLHFQVLKESIVL